MNDAPILSGTPSDLLYLESSGPIALENALLVTDPDNDNLNGAQVMITTNFTATEDRLSFVDQNGISGVYDDNSGVLTLAGQASLADYQSALQSVTYENINERANLDTRTVEFIANDGDLSSEIYARNIVLEEVTDPVIIYQVVTPDGDGMNDSWTIDGIEQYPDNNVNLFNRWNGIVYRKSGYENTVDPWVGEANDGLSSGSLPDGTYFYTVDLGDGGKIREGFLVLKRK